MQTKFTPSVNIIRDSSRELHYIPTPNASRVVTQIVNDFKKGIRSFNIIGSYGTGKSSFLWALKQSLIGKKRYFNINLITNPKIEVVELIGDYRSIRSSITDYLELNPNKVQNTAIFAEIFNRYHDLGKKGPLLIILIDEFGKFLEYASEHSPEQELFFIQQFSEFVNNPDHNILLVTTVHQNIDAYAFGLTSVQKQEWTKVKGRFKEIAFNEPVEQLLFLVSEHLKSRTLDKKVESDIKNIIALSKRSKAFAINSDYISSIASKLYPIDLIAANILTLCLQKYGQNERSLFSFLESTDHTGVNNFDSKSESFYNTASVFDYIIFNFYSYINSRYNPDYSSWAAIKSSLENAANSFDKDTSSYAKIIKSIGLLNMNAASGSVLDKEFLTKYFSFCFGISNGSILIDNLVAKKIIIYRHFSKRYILFEGTDLDISNALIEAGNKVNEISDVATLLNKLYQLPSVYAKAYTYKNGTPRLFDYRISEYPISDIPFDETDGFINLIFNEKLDIKEIKKASLDQNEAIIYGFYQNSKVIKNQLFEIEKTLKVLSENSEDKIAIKELENILFHQKNLLTHYILNNLYSNKSDLKWIFKGKEIIINSKREFNKILSKICEEVYPLTPVFKNELVNKHKISSQIHVAKKNYFNSLFEKWNMPDLGFDPNKFPPEKTIYLTLLKQNGIALYSDEINVGAEINKKSTFIHLWNFSNQFLESAKKDRRKISDFIEPLTRRPFKLKQGLIDFWISTFIFIKRDDFALFGENGYIPNLNDEVLELVVKNPSKFEIKTFDIDGVKLDIFNSYRIFLNQHSQVKIDNQSFIETIKPFLTFYKGLPEYSRSTKRLKKETLALRDAISAAKDPEKSFFEDFPLALGYNESTLQKSKDKFHDYITKLQSSIRELRGSYDSLIDRFEEFILTEFVGESLTFLEYKKNLQVRYKNLKKHLCLQHQKTFIQRLDSQLDDKKSWLASIAQVVLNKSLESIKDEEEIQLYDKFRTIILELDSLTVISREDVDDKKEEMFGIEISSFVYGIKKNLIRLPKTKHNEVLKMEEIIKSKLSNDKALNIAALAHIIKDQLENAEN